MEIQYTFKKGHKPTREEIKACDEGAIGFQTLVVEAAKTINPFYGWIAWFATRFYERTITKEGIRYKFYLIKA